MNADTVAAANKRGIPFSRVADAGWGRGLGTLIRELGVSQVQGYIFGRPATAEDARGLANTVTVEADGYQCIREPRQRLMRRAIAELDPDLPVQQLGTLEERPDDVDESALVRRCAELIGFEAVRAQQKRAEAKGRFGIGADGRLIGVGFASFTEQTAHGRYPAVRAVSGSAKKTRSRT